VIAGTGRRACIALLALAAALAGHGAAAAAPLYSFSLPSLPLSESLRLVARQTGLNVLFDPKVTMGVRAPRLSGAMTADEAFERLLGGTELVHTTADAGSVVVQRPVGEARPPPSPGRAERLQPPAPLATPRLPPAPAPDLEPNLLSELVVTPAKEAESIGRVPVSMTALTQRALDVRGVKTMEDLSRQTPALLVTPAAGGVSVAIPGNGNGFDVSIRGIRSRVGAATTGIYLDDTPLQRYGGPGENVGNGTVFPQLFDLERVEVLKGPQGTLYGSSAEGGVVRFISTAPSLVRAGGYARSGVAATHDGGLSYEAQAAAGGPIVRDRLGFRASVLSRHTGGYIDHVSRFTGEVLDADTNTADVLAGRLALTARPTSRLTVTISAYGSREHISDPDIYWADVPRYSVPARTTGTYTNPAYTYGPYDMFGPYRSGANCNVGDDFAGRIPECVRLQPRTSTLFLPSATAEYVGGTVKLVATTAYVAQQNKGYVDSTSLNFYGVQQGPFFAHNVPLSVSNYIYRAAVRNWSQELRLSSVGDARLGWVIGGFHSFGKTNARAQESSQIEEALLAIRGQTVVQYNGVPLEPGNVIYHWNQLYRTREYAAFGELNYRLTSRLKLIAGVRVSRTSIDYAQEYYGSRQGYLVPTEANGGLTHGLVADTPVTPRYGLQYQASDTAMIYATAAKGFRIGGVNQQPSRQPRCAADLEAIGGQAPPTYGSDSLWSYEAGAKVQALDGRLKLNTSLFWIDWRDIQVRYILPGCASAFTQNANSATSRGFDLNAQLSAGHGFTFTAEAALTDARYTDDVRLTPQVLVIRSGERLPTPKWTYTLSAEYSRTLGSGLRLYARADHRYASAYVTGSGPGALTYAPDAYRLGAAGAVSVRAGASLRRWELTVYADNLFNSQDVVWRTGGRANCGFTAECVPFNQQTPSGAYGAATNVPVFQERTFTPRTVGVTLEWRY
jgi:outer membrane receptor protein involved in Fe transport